MNNDRFKFRAWDNVNKKYDYLECLYLSQSGGVCYLGMDGYLTYPNEDEDYIVEQCTGLRDKNGTLIYEGDIVELINVRSQTVVSWGLGQWVVKYMDGTTHKTPMVLLSANIEVVGNIHEWEREK